MGHQEHRAEGPRQVRIYVITASDTRGPAEDASGSWLCRAVKDAGHLLAGYQVVRDEPEAIRAALAGAAMAGAQVVVANGGTGVARRDRTYEAVAGLLEKRLDGFGELFRMLSWEEVGSAAMLSRAVAGIWQGRAVFSVPGSTGAVRLAWEKLIAPELAHLVRELTKDDSGIGDHDCHPSARAAEPGDQGGGPE